MKRVIFLNRFFYPDRSAHSQVLTDLAFYLAGSGVETHVVTSQQLYDDPDAGLPSEQVVRDVRVHRVSATQFARSRHWGRGINDFSYYLSTRRTLSSIAGQGDVVVAMTDPPLLSIFAMRAIRARGARLVNWVQDIYPEAALQSSVPLISILRDRSLQAAAATVVVGEQMAELLVRHAPSDSVYVIHNWADDEAIQPTSHSDNPLRSRWQLQDKFVVDYSGNPSRAAEFDTILAAAQRLKTHPRIVFVCVGAGHEFDELRRNVERQGLHRTFQFFLYQDRRMLKYSLGVADVHWISLKPQLEGLIVPSKLYGVAAAGRPVIAISAATGEIGKLIKEHGCGIVIQPGDGDALARAIVELANDRERVADMGRRARLMLDTRFSRRHALESWRILLKELPGATDNAA